MLEATPLELSAANEFVATLHRHHDPVHRDKFRIGASHSGRLVGVVQVGRPVSRMLDDGKTVEVVRFDIRYQTLKGRGCEGDRS